MSKKEFPFRIDFNIDTREIVEIYEVSPDGREVRTKDGWVSAYREGIITQRPPHEPGFLTKEQIELAIQAERDILKDKRHKETAAYIVSRKYPMKNWLKGE
jgi:hypothetical protein